MKFTAKLSAQAVSATFLLFPLMSGSVAAASYAPWLTQMGVSDKILSAANWGKGQLLGVVDTGIVANNAVFAPGQVSASLSACAAVSFKCSNGYVDDNNHGTAVAAIAAANRVSPVGYTLSTGKYTVTSGSAIGVAPNANIFAEKVLNAAGSGYSTDVANGLRKAADAGATVINLSLTFGNSADLVSAINYAAGKGAYIVWAGGNSAQTLLGGANTTGLTAAAISHLVLAGSVSPTNALSSFSNTPGSGALVNTANAKTTYSARWITAPGEGILAPYATAGSGAWASWSGTSMSAPLVSGSLMLLQSAWPILKTNGTTANLLLATATDLGTKGIDATFGTGLVNLATAFQPYGNLSVTKSNGTTTPVTSLSGALISSGALGSFAAVQSKLANYTAFDTYARNFSVNLSGLIKTPSSAATTNPLPSNTNTGPTIMRLDDGGELAYLLTTSGDPMDPPGILDLMDSRPEKRIGYAMLTDKLGNTTALGYGMPVQFSYAKALYGNDDIARLSGELGVSNLSALAQGGALFAYGTALTSNTRLAMSWSNTDNVQSFGNSAPDWASARATNLGIGLTHQFNEQLIGSLNFGSLAENHGLLGSTYDTNSLVNLGASNQTRSMGLSLGVLLDRSNSLLLEAAVASTKGHSANGLFAGTSDIQSRAFGMTLMSRNLINPEDTLTVSVKQPLRVVAGQAALVMPSVDSETGVASFTTDKASLVPTGRELDYQLSYSMPLQKNRLLSIQTGLRQNMFNIQGSNAASAGIAWSVKF
jgi:hypothetical protein